MPMPCCQPRIQCSLFLLLTGLVLCMVMPMSRSWAMMMKGSALLSSTARTRGRLTVVKMMIPSSSSPLSLPLRPLRGSLDGGETESDADNQLEKGKDLTFFNHHQRLPDVSDLSRQPHHPHPDTRRRQLLSLLGPTWLAGACFGLEWMWPPPGQAFNPLFPLPPRPSTSSSSSPLFVVPPETSSTSSLQRRPVSISNEALSSELCLLKLLPINNPFFRQLESALEGVSVVSAYGSSLDYDLNHQDEVWTRQVKTLEATLLDLDKKRFILQPYFNPDENTMLQIAKNERCEQLIEHFRNDCTSLMAATRAHNVTAVLGAQKRALLSLSQVGELLVAQFPYDVPTEGKYSYLPRLLGRCRVTLTFRRGRKGPLRVGEGASSQREAFRILGNVTIVADGFTAPITAGNFVDLSLRQFYTGLPVKMSKKRLGYGASSSSSSASDFEVATVPILGSFQEGFYDPLTAKPRRLPLEIIRLDKSSGLPELSYAQGLSDLAAVADLQPLASSSPLLTFEIPGLVAMNHPDKNPNGASSEFFGLQSNSMLDDKRGLLDGDYAPFGYIVQGLEVFEQLQANDVIDATHVDEWGQLYLVKLRQSSFSEVVQGSESEV